MKRLSASTAALALMVAAPALAGTSFVGDTIDASYYFPDLSTLYSDQGLKVVTPPADYSFNIGADLFADVSANQITLTFDSAGFFNGGTFNGLVITDTTSANIIGAVLDGSSTLSPVVTFTGDTVDINFAGVTDFLATDKVVVDVTFGGAPEPAVWALMLVGFAGMGAALRTRRRLLTA